MDQEHRTEYPPSPVERVHAEYREMPGLSLTVQQASRLCGMHVWATEQVLEELVSKGILYKARGGVYVAAPRTRSSE